MTERKPNELTAARDAAILAALAKGPKPVSELLDAMPREPGQTPEQRDNAVRNACTRLQSKKRIKQTDDGWALA